MGDIGNFQFTVCPSPLARALLFRERGFMNLLLAIDESCHSEAAVDAVLRRVHPEAVSIRVLHVVEWPKSLATSFSFAEGPSAAECILAVHEAMRNDGRALLARSVARLQDAHFVVSSSLAEGDVRQAIIDEAAAWPADLIVLGSHGRTGFNRLMLGSVSEAVVRHAPCSVEVVRGHEAARSRDVVSAA
jgi:nucleotide-binding universal stress UspA family protein